MSLEMQRLLPSQNNGGRRLTEKIFTPVASFIHKIRPSTTANEITKWSLYAWTLGITLSELFDNKLGKVAAGIVMGVSACGDATDGIYARKYGQVSDQGAIDDMMNDRKAAAYARGVMAFFSAVRGNRADAFWQSTAIAVHAQPAWRRVQAEVEGVALSEAGKWLPSKGGVHPARMTLIIAATVVPAFVPEKYKLPIRIGLTLLSGGCDIVSALERVNFRTTGQEVNDPLERKRLVDTALKKYPHMEKFATQSLKTAIGLASTLPLIPRR